MYTLKEKMEILAIKTININGIEHLTVKNFSKLSDMTSQNINKLVKVGNKFGEKMKSFRIDSKTLIPITELFNYNFVNRKGRCYSFDNEGNRIEKPFPKERSQ